MLAVDGVDPIVVSDTEGLGAGRGRSLGGSRANVGGGVSPGSLGEAAFGFTSKVASPTPLRTTGESWRRAKDAAGILRNRKPEEGAPGAKYRI